MAITKVQSYKTSDGVIHKTKGEAVAHEGFISLRGIIQTHIGRETSASYTPTSMAEVMVKNPDAFINALCSIRRAKKSLTIHSKPQ